MTGRGCRSAAWQDKIFERRQRVVEGVEILLEAIDLLGCDELHAGDAEFTAEVEQVVLHCDEAGGHGRGQSGHCEHHADGAVGFIDRAVGLDARGVLRDTGTVAETGGAIVARAGVDLAQTVAHGR